MSKWEKKESKKSEREEKGGGRGWGERKENRLNSLWWWHKDLERKKKEWKEGRKGMMTRDWVEKKAEDGKEGFSEAVWNTIEGKE